MSDFPQSYTCKQGKQNKKKDKKEKKKKKKNGKMKMKMKKEPEPEPEPELEVESDDGHEIQSEELELEVESDDGIGIGYDPETKSVESDDGEFNSMDFIPNSSSEEEEVIIQKPTTIQDNKPEPEPEPEPEPGIKKKEVSQDKTLQIKINKCDEKIKKLLISYEGEKEKLSDKSSIEFDKISYSLEKEKIKDMKNDDFLKENEIEKIITYKHNDILRLLTNANWGEYSVPDKGKMFNSINSKKLKKFINDHIDKEEKKQLIKKTKVVSIIKKYLITIDLKYDNV